MTRKQRNRKLPTLNTMTLVGGITLVEVCQETNEVYLKLSAFNLMDAPFEVSAYLSAGKEPFISVVERLETERINGNKVALKGAFVMCDCIPHLIDPDIWNACGEVLHEHKPVDEETLLKGTSPVSTKRRARD